MTSDRDKASKNPYEPSKAAARSTNKAAGNSAWLSFAVLWLWVAFLIGIIGAAFVFSLYDVPTPPSTAP